MKFKGAFKLPRFRRSRKSKLDEVPKSTPVPHPSLNRPEILRPRRKKIRSKRGARTRLELAFIGIGHEPAKRRKARRDRDLITDGRAHRLDTDVHRDDQQRTTRVVNRHVTKYDPRVEDAKHAKARRREPETVPHVTADGSRRPLIKVLGV